MTGPDEFVGNWERELQLSLEYKEKFSSSKDWLKYFDYYRGKYASDLVYVNKIFSYVRSLQPRIYFRKPMVTITPKRPEMAMGAKILEAVDNYLINELMLKNPLKDTSLFGILCGTGVLKLGFDSEFGYASTQVLGADGETLTQVGKDGHKIEYNTNIKPGMPWADSASPLDIFTPWGIRDVASLPWVAHAILRPIEDIKSDPKYRNVKDLKGGFERHGVTSSYREMLRRTGQNISNELNLGLLWEIRDWKRREIVVISEGNVLLREPDELQIEGLPYEFLIFNRDPEHFWGIADVEQIVRQQLEYNSVRTTINKHVRLSVLKFLVGRGLLKKEELDKFLSEDVGPAIEVNSDSPGSAIVQLAPHVPPDLYNHLRQIDQDFSDTLGFNENTGGSFAQGTPPTALEVSTANMGVTLRSDERRDMMADMLVNVLRKWNQFIFKFWKGEKVIKIAGPMGGAQWVSFTGSDIVGEYAINIEAESGQPITRDIRSKQASALWGMFRNDPMVDQMQLRRIILSQFEWIDPSWGMILPPDQAMLQAAQMQPLGLNPASGSSYTPSGPPSEPSLRTPGSSPENPASMEQMTAMMPPEM